MIHLEIRLEIMLWIKDELEVPEELMVIQNRFFKERKHLMGIVSLNKVPQLMQRLGKAEVMTVSFETKALVPLNLFQSLGFQQIENGVWKVCAYEMEITLARSTFAYDYVWQLQATHVRNGDVPPVMASVFQRLIRSCIAEIEQLVEPIVEELMLA